MGRQPIPVAALVVDDDDRILEVNDAARVRIGRAEEELVGTQLAGVVSGLPAATDPARFRAVWPGALCGVPAQLWCCRLAPDRAAVVVLEAQPAMDADGTLALVMAGVEQSPDGFEITGETGCAEYVNPALLKLLERTQFETLGVPVWRYLASHDAAAVEAAVNQRDSFRGEVRVLMPSGAVRIHEFAMHPVTDEVSAQQRFIVVRRDVTARVRAEREIARLRQRLAIADRQAIVGQLSAIVAHEMNNPATFVLANLRLALEDLGAVRGELTSNPEGTSLGALAANLARIEEMLRDVKAGGERIVSVVRGMRDATAAEPLNRERVVVADLVREALALSRSTLSERARLEEDYASAAVVVANRVALGQVFVNLLADTVAALPDVGAGEHALSVSTRDDGEFVEVILNTAGTPPPRHVGVVPHPRLEPSAWTGERIGLERAHSVVTALGGTLTETALDSAGKVFTVRLPRARS